jgi:hypothetical protein
LPSWSSAIPESQLSANKKISTLEKEQEKSDQTQESISYKKWKTPRSGIAELQLGFLILIS